MLATHFYSWETFNFLFMHSLIEEHLCGFCFKAIMGDGTFAIIFCEYIQVSFLKGIYPGMRYLDYMISMYLWTGDSSSVKRTSSSCRGP